MLPDMLSDSADESVRRLMRPAPSPVRGLKKPSGIAGDISAAGTESHGGVGHSDLKELFERVYDAAFITDFAGRIIDANIRAVQFFDYTREELCAMTMADIVLGLNASLVQTICENLERDRFTIIQAYCSKKDGGRIPAEISTSRLSLSAKEYLCFFVRDITARRQAEEALQKANSELESEVRERTKVNDKLNEAIVKLREHDRAKSEFVSNVSHELKTPLTSMRYMTENMLRGIVGEMQESAREYLTMIREDCDRLWRTVEDILDMSRIEANRLQLNKGKIEFARFARRAAESLRIQAESEGMSLTVAVNGIVGFVDCDPKKMERVVFNVIRNAIKFNEENGGIHVALTKDPEKPEFLTLDVTDTGIGIPQEYLARVTERFFRVGEHISGTGLGLAICKEIVERHGGELDIKSPPPGQDKGTLVRIRVPIAAPTTVLLASGATHVRSMVAEQLAKNGYAQTSCEIAQTLNAVLNAHPDILMLDWTSSGMESAIVIGQIKCNQDLRDTRMVALLDEEPNRMKIELLKGFGIPSLRLPWSENALLDGLEEIVFGKKYLSA